MLEVRIMKRIFLVMLVLIGLISIGIMWAVSTGTVKNVASDENASIKKKDELRKKLPVLIDKLKIAKGKDKILIIRDLGYSEDERAIPLLIGIIKDKGEDIKNKRESITALANMKEKKQFIPVLKEAFKNDKLKVISGYTLCVLEENENTLPFLEQYAKDGHPEVLFYKDSNNKKKYFNENQAKEIYINMLYTKNDDINARVATYLLDMGENDKARQVVFKIAKDTKTIGSERGRIMTYVIYVLEKIGDKESIDVLYEILTNENSRLIKDQAEMALSKLNRQDLIGQYKLNEIQKK